MIKKYINPIIDKTTDFPFRFKTEEEFISEFGNNWRSYTGWGSSGPMDNLFGKNFEIKTGDDKIEKIFFNPRITYQGYDYIEYTDNETHYTWDVCPLMVTDNKKLGFEYMYLKNKENVYENVSNNYSCDIFYRILNDEDREKVKTLLEREGFNIKRLTDDKILVIGIYKYEKPSYVDSDKQIYMFGNMSDDELIRKNIEYNNGNYVFANTIDELEYYIKQNICSVGNIINKRKNIYESKNENVIFDIYYRPSNAYELDKSLYFLYNKDIIWENEYDKNNANFDSIKVLIVSITEKRLFKYDYNYTDEFIINDNFAYNHGNYEFVYSFESLEHEVMKKIGSNLENMLQSRKNVYEDNTIIKFSDFENLEYRKGSKEYGGIVTKLLEFLRLYDTQDDLVFNIEDFVKKSNISIEEIQKLLQSKEKGQKLYVFEIEIQNDTIHFKNLNKTGKNRPFESNNN